MDKSLLRTANDCQNKNSCKKAKIGQNRPNISLEFVKEFRKCNKN